MTVPERVGPRRRPLRVGPRAGDDWERIGRAVFLNRVAYEAARGRRLRVENIDRKGSMSAVLLQLLVACGALYAVREVTRLMCPPALAVHDWLVGKLYRVGQRLLRFVKEVLVKDPARRFGFAFTVWLWLAGLAVLVTLVSVTRPGLATFALAPLCWLLVVWAWRAVRWWAARRYRVRVLPARRVRRVEP